MGPGSRDQFGQMGKAGSHLSEWLACSQGLMAHLSKLDTVSNLDKLPART